MSDEIAAHIAAVEAFYEPLITGPGSTLQGGGKLWRQFQDAVAAYRTQGKDKFSAVFERINEMDVARIMLADPTLSGASVAYEPEIAKDGSRIDFLIMKTDGSTLYAEVKSVHPKTEDSDENWEKYEERREHHTDDTHYIVHKGWLGAEIYGDSFSARSKFMSYTRAFERRLEEARKVRPGVGVLIFCGTGSKWHCDELEDFSDFYRTGKHRRDDTFAKMEAESLRVHDLELKRNIEAFGCVTRAVDRVASTNWLADVRGPREFRG